MELLAFSPDGRRVLTVSKLETGIGQWDAQTGEPLGVLGGHGNDLLDFAFAPDGGSAAPLSKLRDTPQQLDKGNHLLDIGRHP